MQARASGESGADHHGDGKIEEIDRLLGLDAGADDYVCKPFSPVRSSHGLKVFSVGVRHTILSQRPPISCVWIAANCACTTPTIRLT